MGIRMSHGDDDLAESHEINVTPFIDVMLVLLIIFMVAAPLATVDVKVDLPDSNAAPTPKPEKPIHLSIKADGGWAVDSAPVTRADLTTTLDSASGGDKDQRIFVRADKSVDYDQVMQAMNGLRAAGYYKVALVGLDSPQ